MNTVVKAQCGRFAVSLGTKGKRFLQILHTVLYVIKQACSRTYWCCPQSQRDTALPASLPVNWDDTQGKQDTECNGQAVGKTKEMIVCICRPVTCPGWGSASTRLRPSAPLSAGQPWTLYWTAVPALELYPASFPGCKQTGEERATNVTHAV